ncbi:MAG: hypothetical protein JWP29_5642 [Rhodoferax sp.]|nr:hypothetical protein [Rhodoferax sp.]
MSVLSRASSTLRSGFQAIPLNPARQALLDTTIQTIQRRGGPLTAKELKALSKQLDPWSVVKIQVCMESRVKGVLTSNQNYIDARLHSLDHDNGFTELNQQEEGNINNIYTSTSITIATPPPSQYSPPVPHYPAPPPPPSPELEPSGSSLVGFFNDLDDTLFLAMVCFLFHNLVIYIV